MLGKSEHCKNKLKRKDAKEKIAENYDDMVIPSASANTFQSF